MKNCKFNNPYPMKGYIILEKNTREERNFTTNSTQETTNQLLMMETSPEETPDPNNVKLQYAVDSLRQEFIQQLEDTYQRTPCKMDRIPFQSIEFKGRLIDKFEAERINAELEILAHRHEIVNAISHEQKDESLWQEISGQEELAKQIESGFDKVTNSIQEKLEGLMMHWELYQ
ncbi:hypothetical protein WUBG_13453 [Wuchereria bancrofti]|uniref:Uncharacterized protein n=1 Tax=Wuchereria bancrofti TaxID=6293 RepID=J9EF42_WUCBA|nr:hypothetical protein WUBG_13453 [Wuchereria bancrofti]